MKNSKFDLAHIVVVVCVLIGLLGLYIYIPINKVTNIRQVTVTVTEKTVKNYSKSGSKYLVFGQDENGQIHTFEVTDSLLCWRFNSSDVYGEIKSGNKYDLTVGGDRVKFLSLYPNIYEADEVVATDETAVDEVVEEVASYNNASEHELAILVNNHDYPMSVIEAVAINNGYQGYDDMVQQLVEKQLLYHIPSFTHDGVEYKETYSTKNTIVYAEAIEAGILKEAH